MIGVDESLVFNKMKAVSVWHVPKMSIWKRKNIAAYLGAGQAKIIWRKQYVQSSSQLLTWGSKSKLENKESNSWFIEDGFIHSLGLGSDLSPPYSQIIDTQGIYFDPSHNNDLFDLLNYHHFDAQLLQRAKQLRSLMIQAQITKYNLGRRACDWTPPVGKKIILVLGQVADDASVLLGGSLCFSSFDKLLDEIANQNKDAYLVYKPHPDVLSGNRKGVLQNSAAYQVDTQSDIISLIELADEVHTISSLAGFEALIRLKKVYVYGRPFYAGWGLTHDFREDIPFRQRKVTLDELVAAAYILYPLYWDWESGEFSTPEAIIHKLSPMVSRQRQTTSRTMRLVLNGLRWCRNVISYFLHKHG